MPAEYLACVKSEQKRGKDHKTAQKICAIRYYKTHGKSVQAAAKEKGEKMEELDVDMKKAYENKGGSIETNTGTTEFHQGTGKTEEHKEEKLESGVVVTEYLIPDMLPLSNAEQVKQALEHYYNHFGIYDIDQRKNMVAKLRQACTRFKVKCDEEELMESLEANLHFETSRQTHSAGGDSGHDLTYPNTSDKKEEIKLDLVKFYAPITKIDEEKRMVYGYATTGTEDSQGEIVDLQASFDAVDEYKEWATIKEMHNQQTAAGIATVIEKHPGVGVYVGTNIVDDQAWKKVMAKVYRGFSIGGKTISKVKGEDGKTHITKYKLHEISLVDKPANPDTLFQVMKRDFTADADASKEANGGKSMEKKDEASTTEALPSMEKAQATASKPDAETVSISKADHEKMVSRLAELEKQTEVREILLKMAAELKPIIKKEYEEVKTQPKTAEEQKAELRAIIDKASVGELTSAMLKATKPKE